MQPPQPFHSRRSLGHVRRGCPRLPGKSSGPRTLLDHVGQQTEEPRALDGARQLTLLLGRHRGDAARHDLAALGDVAAEQAAVLVVDLRRAGAGERARLAAAVERTAGLGGCCCVRPSGSLRARSWGTRRTITARGEPPSRGGRSPPVARKPPPSRGGRSPRRQPPEAATSRGGRSPRSPPPRTAAQAAATVAATEAAAVAARKPPRSPRSPRSSRSLLRIWADGSVSCASTLTVMKRMMSVLMPMRRSISVDRRRRCIDIEQRIMGLAVLLDLERQGLQAPVLGLGDLALACLDHIGEFLGQRLDLCLRHVLTRKEHMLVERHALPSFLGCPSGA